LDENRIDPQTDGIRSSPPLERVSGPKAERLSGVHYQTAQGIAADFDICDLRPQKPDVDGLARLAQVRHIEGVIAQFFQPDHGAKATRHGMQEMSLDEGRRGCYGPIVRQ